MLPEYDFANMKGGVRGRYYKAYREGHTVEIHKADGTTSVQSHIGRDELTSTVEYTYWQDGDTFLGFLNDHPDYWTQGDTRSELIENLKDILADIASGEVSLATGKLILR